MGAVCLRVNSITCLAVKQNQSFLSRSSFIIVNLAQNFLTLSVSMLFARGNMTPIGVILPVNMRKNVS